MSTYVISDLHGCKQEFDEMLDLIEFSDYDTMYIIGDVCDRGPHSIDLLLEIMNHPNMHLIMGNHDQWLSRYCLYLIQSKKDLSMLHPNFIEPDLKSWMSVRNGGQSTVDQFLDLDYPTCYDIMEYLENVPTYKVIHILNTTYLLVHAGFQETKAYSISDLNFDPRIILWTHIGIDDNPLKDMKMIVGHVPTFTYGPSYNGKIIEGKDGMIYHIDCGCVFGKTLGCLRLDDMQEFYIKSQTNVLKKRP